MSGPIGSSQWMYNSSTGFYSTTIDQSLRFNDADDHYLNRVSTTGDRQKWTWSGWLKRSTLGNVNAIFSEGGTGNSFALYFWSDNTILAQARDSSSNVFVHQTSALFRDTSAWYHVVYAHDSTQTTDTDRVNLYVNGVEQSIVAVSGNDVYPDKDEQININNGGNHSTGYAATNSFDCFDGCMAEVHFVDGQQLNATDFGELSNGVWVPKEYSGSYGTNGYRLTFSSNSFTDNTSDPDVFADQAGSNNHNAYNFKVSDIILDSPTNSFCVFNELDKQSNISLQEGGLKVIYTGTSDIFGAYSTFHMTSGKWYAEFRLDSLGGSSYPNVGITKSEEKSTNFLTTTQVNVKNGATTSEGTSGTSIDTFANGDILGIAFDADNGRIYFSKNGTFGQSQDPAAGTGAIFTGLTNSLGYKWGLTSYSSRHAIANFGQDSTFADNETAGGNSDGNGVGDFAYAPPSGFLALCTSNLPEPTIGPNSTTQADDYFDIVLYSGNGTAVASGGNAITSVNFAPEFVWLKRRDATANHGMYSVVQGAGVGVIPSQDSYASFSNTETLNSFDSNGFTLGSNTTNNASSSTNISWNWKLGGTPTVDNSAGAGAVPTAGSVKIDGSNSTATLAGTIPALRQSVNTTAGISITKYVGTGSNATIAHSLTETPELVICKNLDTTKDFMVFCDVFAATQYLRLNGATDGIKVLTTASTIWNDTAPTSTVVSIGTSGHVNTLNDNHIMWAFHSVEGYCKITQYTGNGNSDGAFCFLGFRARLFIIRSLSTSNTRNWPMFNTETYTYNSDTEVFLRANRNDDEFSGSTRDIDILSNGLKMRNTSNNINGNGEKYLVIAWAENPFKYANAR